MGARGNGYPTERPTRNGRKTMNENPSYQLISADSHVVEPPDIFAGRLPANLRDRAPKLESVDGGSAWVLDGLTPVPLPATAATGSGYRHSTRADGKPVTFDDVLPGATDPAERLKAQDSDSVDAEVLYPSPDLWDAIATLEDRDLKLACTRAYNDWIAEFSAHSPDRLIGLAKIPTTTCEDTRDELLRAVNDLNLRGVILDAWPCGGTSADADNDPFWDAVNDTGVPVSLHYAVGAGQRTAPPSGIAPGLKPPVADAAVPMVAAGVFDRFPKVRLVFAHADAGWAFHWLEFMDIAYVRHRHLDIYKLADPDAVPSEYIRKHSWFTFHQDRPAVKYRSKVGVTNLLWASHFPAEESDWPDDRQQAMRLTNEVSADERQALLADNTARLYRLPGFQDGFADADLQTFEPFVHY
jgi:predicted TIM-barrel fold metal-dependent hydrolase